MPKVSVIVPSYNSARLLPAALDSALSQTFRDLEVLVIDDGSTDNTREVVADYMNKDPRVRYFYQENQGLACARNTAIAKAEGEYLALLDADDVWLPERLRATVEVMDSDPEIGVVHANITRISAEGAVLETPARDRRFLEGDMFENIFLRRENVSCPTVLFRKAGCDKVGMFDPHLARLGVEDRELWLRFAVRDRVVYIDKVLAYYRVSGSSMSRNKEKMLKARLYVVDKFAPPGGSNGRLRAMALSRIYRDMGDEALEQRDFPEAGRNYRKAIFCDPFAFWAWANLAKSLLRRGA